MHPNIHLYYFLLINALFVAGQLDGIAFSGRAAPAWKNETDEYCTVAVLPRCIAATTTTNASPTLGPSTGPSA
jgi:hypothetical protein